MPTQKYIENKRKYISGYNHRNYKYVSLMFRTDNPDEMAAYDFIRSQPSTVQFIKEAIKEKIASLNKKDGE